MLIPLKLVRDKPLQRQLYEQLRALIVASRLAPGARMPSTRMLADQFSIARITVLLTYERLIAEGYLRTIPAKGTFVHRPAAADVPAARAGDVTGPHSAPERAVGRAEPHSAPERAVGRADPKLFPAVKWRALIRTALDSLGGGLADEAGHGDAVLRKAIAQWLSTSRGLVVDAEQIIPAPGRQHALLIAAHMLLRPGDRAVIEAPGDPSSELLLGGTGANLVAVPVDDDGIRTERLPAGRASMALVTLEHQRPLGSVLSLQRRHELLAWAAQAGATVIEEDSDGELSYEEMVAPSLMSLDREGIVLHAGGFAASLGPGMVVGYLAVPPRLIGSARAAGRLAGAYAGRLEAEALATMLHSGSYARHLHEVRKVYLSRRDAMMQSLRRHFRRADADRRHVGGAAPGVDTEAALGLGRRGGGYGVPVGAGRGACRGPGRPARVRRSRGAPDPGGYRPAGRGAGRRGWGHGDFRDLMKAARCGFRRRYAGRCECSAARQRRLRHYGRMQPSLPTYPSLSKSRQMARVRSKDTEPEIAVRRALHARGYRFRLHRRDLPGKPDIVLPGHGLAILVHGCFWHGCLRCDRGRRLPKTNVPFWTAKLSANRERDRRSVAELEASGWRVAVLWECEIRAPGRLDGLLEACLTSERRSACERRSA